jgi:hypothetical protein
MRLPRTALGGIAASAFTALSLCVAPAASATTAPDIDAIACSITEINDEEASFRCDLTWVDGTAPYTVTARSYDYGHVDWIVSDGQSATVYGWCRVEKYLNVHITVTDATGAADSTGWTGYCRNTDLGY